MPQHRAEVVVNKKSKRSQMSMTIYPLEKGEFKPLSGIVGIAHILGSSRRGSGPLVIMAISPISCTLTVAY
ncbi:MAG: hypothetical protein M3156_04340 [Thermoproteota archaeon]|nr:hypothetical protein [Thermoproteota archaeon]